MYVLQNLHWFVLFIGALVFFHELGHFLIAKLCDVKVLKFSLGFGPKLLGFTRGETEYVVSALPLGGFVKMLGEVPGSEVPPEEAPRAFNNKPVWQRAAIVLAGPVFNFGLALVVYYGIFAGGFLAAGDTRLGLVDVGEPAWTAGLRPGDRITAVDGHEVRYWDQVRSLIGERPGAKVRVTFERDGEMQNVEIHTHAKSEVDEFKDTHTRGRIGVLNHYVRPIIAVIDTASPAAQAGLATGDEIVEVAGKPVIGWHEVRNVLRESAAGAPVPLKVKRGEQTVDVTLTPAAPEPSLRPELFSSADTLNGYTGLVTKESIVEQVEPDTPAAAAGLQKNDRLLALAFDKDGKHADYPIDVWRMDLAALEGIDPRTTITLTFQRGREVISRQQALEEREETDDFKNTQKRLIFGAFNDPATLAPYERKLGAMESLRFAVQMVGRDMTIIAKGLSKLASGQIPLSSMGGPMMIFVIAEKSANSSLVEFFMMMAMISVNLGLVNLLPIPVLDGGHLVFLTLEGVRRRPPSLRVREVANVVGLAILFTLMVIVLWNDTWRFVLP
jgi:regulator of sigma E protease